MFKHLVLVGTLVGSLGAIPFAQAPATGSKPTPATGTQDTAKPAKPARKAVQAKTTGTAGHEAPKAQPETAPAPTAPTGEMALGTIHLPKGVKADGKMLAAGTYQVRLTGQSAAPPAKGETPTLERWVEFVQRGQVKGREVVTIVPQSEIDKVQKDTPPHANSSKVETLKGGDYVRVWISKGGNHYLLHLTTSA